MPNNEAFSGRASETRGAWRASRARPLETLTTLRDWGLKLGAISNTVQPARYMHQAHIRRGLAPFFDVEVYSSEVGVAKPHPQIFRAALDALGVAPECAAYVGDRLRADVAGAQAVGMKGILIEVAHRPSMIRPSCRMHGSGSCRSCSGCCPVSCDGCSHRVRNSGFGASWDCHLQDNSEQRHDLIEARRRARQQ